MKNLICFGRIITLLSFLLGTIIFSLYLYFDNSNDIGKFGLYFVIIALIINTLLFLVNLIAIIIEGNNRLELIKTCGLMLLNIPFAILYFYIVISIELAPKG